MATETQRSLGLGSSVEPITLELPWPPSVNHYFMEYAMPPAESRIREQVAEHGWKGLHYWLRKNTRVMKRVGEKGHQYRADVQEIVLVARKNKGLMGPLRLILRAFPPDRRERDLDGLYKALLDAMEHAGVYISDYQIGAHDSLREVQVIKGGRLVVTLEELVY